MRVGLTYDLRSEYLEMGYGKEETAELDKEDTIDAIEGEPKALGYETERIGNLFSLTKLLARGKTWDIVFNIAEGFKGRNRESQVPAMLELLDIPYTGSDPATLSLALDKALAKKIVRQHGILTPDFFIMNTGKERLPKDLAFPLIVKPVAEGSSKGVHATIPKALFSRR